MNNFFNLSKLRQSIAEILLMLMIFCLIAVSNDLLAETNQQDRNQQDEQINNPPLIDLIIDDITCRGNENTECSFITKKYYQQVGERVDANQITDAKLRLGTLQQLKNVRIQLEKSSQRGHVIVVFIVEEASHIQYSLAAGYSGYKIPGNNGLKYTGDNLFLSTEITDYNFLASGKQLSVSLGSSYYQSDYGRDITTTYSDDQIRFHSAESSFNEHALGINYYDPHLFDSVDYFLSASANYSKFERNSDSYIISAEGDIYNLTDLKSTQGSYNLSIGKRFASYSYLSLQSFYWENSSDHSLSLNYGWDSRDNLLFPTQGSVLNAKLFGLESNNFKSLNISYENNIALNKDKIISYGLNQSFEYDKNSDNNNELRPHLSLGFSDIDRDQSKSGKYSGWKYQLFMPVKDLSLEQIGLGLIYTRQTNDLILKFSVNYQMDWGDIQ